ncbi:phenylacetate--CoA ligase family protein [Haloarchaeobius baliensis]|uniref:phenylacetate--CoA ligase family protein n=1 Tax=Haloarchaeobius baliensis TaxID=1670458 RepID=UPI003F880DD6
MHDPGPLEQLRVRADALRANRVTADEIASRRRRRLESLLEFVIRQSRFYRRHYEDVDRPITELESLPPVTKRMLMAQFDDVVTDTAVTRGDVEAFMQQRSNIGRRFQGRYPVWTTSGTTGDPGVFLQDERAMTAADAVSDRWTFPVLLAPRTLRRFLGHDFRIAEIAVSGGHFAAASGVAMFRREHAFLRDRLELFSPTRPLPELVTALDEFDPALLIGYGTVLVELAREQRAGRLDIAPALVVPGGEGITENEKRLLRRTFDCTVRELYGASEFYAIACECAHGRLHVNTDWVVLEPVDEDYQPVQPGTPSDTVLLTNLANHIQPLVRYDLGDSVTMFEEPCDCGSPFPVLEVEGRQGDVLRFETDTGELATVFPLALTTVVEAVPGVVRTQILRTGRRTLQVRLETSRDRDEVWNQVHDELEAHLASQGVTDLSIQRGASGPQRDPQSGKFRHVWSEHERAVGTEGEL